MSVTARPTRHLPNELYREIAKNLHQRRDKSALLSLALVNKLWRHESQRVLFRSLSNDWYTGVSTTKTHILFMESILAYPSRLGPYVYLYAQDGLGINPEAIEKSDDEEYSQGIHLWDLTGRALSTMINLKHLLMHTLLNGSGMVDHILTTESRFQLETFIWTCDENSKDSLIDFLRTQQGLTHLEVGNPAEESDLEWLSPEICPSINSVACILDSVHLLAPRRGIIALKADAAYVMAQLHGIQDMCPLISVLENIRYLSLWTYYPSRMLSWPVASNTSLLELLDWDLKTLRSLPPAIFPSLRVLALPYGDHILEDLALITQVSIIAFERFPKLEQIFIRPLNLGMPFGSHLKMSLDPTNADAKVDIAWILGDCRQGLQWWKIYDM